MLSSSNNFVEAQDGVVKIDDVKLPVLEALIRWLYTGEIQDPHLIVQELYEVADKYQITELKV